MAELSLSFRTSSRSAAAGIPTCGGLAARSQLQLLGAGHLNASSLDDIQAQLRAVGLRLRDDGQG